MMLVLSALSVPTLFEATKGTFTHHSKLLCMPGSTASLSVQSTAKMLCNISTDLTEQGSQ